MIVVSNDCGLKCLHTATFPVEEKVWESGKRVYPEKRPVFVDFVRIA